MLVNIYLEEINKGKRKRIKEKKKKKGALPTWANLGP